jgi:hypothetical protein
VGIFVTMELAALAIQKALHNEWEEAASLNEAILLEEPTNIDALNRLAQAYIQLGKYRPATTLYQQVIKLDHFNPIACRNLIKLKNIKKNGSNTPLIIAKNVNFIEEPGKTKVLSLVRLGEKAVLTTLEPCLELEMRIRLQTISLYYQNKYIGRLPDDIAKRLIWLHKRDNKYAAYIRSIDKNRVTVFIKETKCSLKNKNYYSFVNLEKINNLDADSESLAIEEG